MKFASYVVRAVRGLAEPFVKKSLPDRLIKILREVEESQELLSAQHFEEIVQTAQRLARDGSRLDLPAAAELVRGAELVAMTPQDRLLDALRSVERDDSLAPGHFEELLQTAQRLARGDARLGLPVAAELVRGAELAGMSPQDRLIDALRSVERDDSLPPGHFEELIQTAQRLARGDARLGLPAAADLVRGAELAGMSPQDRLIDALRSVEREDSLAPGHFEELLQTAQRLARDGSRLSLPAAAELIRASDLAAMSPQDRLIDALRSVERDDSLAPGHFEELLQTAQRLARDEARLSLPTAAELIRASDLAAMSPQDRLIDALRSVERDDSLAPGHFEELLQTAQRLARDGSRLSLPAAAELIRASDLAGMSPQDRLIDALRSVEREDSLSPGHFEELLQTFIRMARRDEGELFPGGQALIRASEFAALNPPDQLITSLRQVDRLGCLPVLHFKELAQTALQIAQQGGEYEATLDTALGARQIAAGQNAIVRNLASTVIGANRFLVIDVGAHDGWFIDRILEKPRDIHVIAFEPMPEMVEELAKRKETWPSIEVFQMAVGEGPDTLPLRVYPKIPGLSSLLDFEPGYNYFKGHFDPAEFHVVDVPVVSLDDHFRDHPELMTYENVALKVDVQGFEDRVLLGAKDLLSSGRVKAILIELVTRAKYTGSWDYLRLLQFLDESGFVLYDVNPFYREIGMEFQSTGLGRLTEMDCLFVAADFLAQITAQGENDPPRTES